MALAPIDPDNEQGRLVRQAITGELSAEAKALELTAALQDIHLAAQHTHIAKGPCELDAIGTIAEPVCSTHAFPWPCPFLNAAS